MRDRLMKVYAIILSLGLILFAWWFKHKAFMGGNQSALAKVNAFIDAQAHPDRVVEAPTAPATPPPAAAASAAPPAPAVAAAGASAAEPEKGGLGDAVKKIREREGQHNAAIEKAFEQ